MTTGTALLDTTGWEMFGQLPLVITLALFVILVVAALRALEVGL